MIALDYTEVLVGIAEVAIALAGFSGVVVVFGSRSAGRWDPGDRLRLTFLLEADALTPEERMRLEQHVLGRLQRFDNIYYQHQSEFATF